ncbi:MAG: RNA recognition motif domain-containing protein [Chthoniobacterales bacterium]
MSASYSSSRRSPRPRSGGRRPSGPSKKPQRSAHHAPAKAVPVSFFSKILGFFGIGSSKKDSSKKEAFTKTNRATKERAPRTPRKPECVEVTSPRLYIGNLSFDATESDLFELFSGIGQVQNVELVSNRDTHRSKGFGFVQMTVLEEAKRAVTELHDKEYMGRKLVVSGAKDIPANRTESRSESHSETSLEESH